MISFFNKNKKVIFIATTSVFLGGLAGTVVVVVGSGVGLGPAALSQSSSGQATISRQKSQIRSQRQSFRLSENGPMRFSDEI